MKYTEEYKKNLVNLYINGKCVREIISEHDIPKVTFYRWLKKYREIRISEDEVMTAEDIQALQKKIAKLEEENLILKKTITIFTKDAKTVLLPLDD